MEAIKFKLKDGKVFTDRFGVNHVEAVLVPGYIANSMANGKLEVIWLIYANPESVYKKDPLTPGFTMAFDSKSTPNHTDTDGSIIEYGHPSYSQVMTMFDIKDDGIYIEDPSIIQWLMGASSVHGRPLSENWELVTNAQ
ncbi:MAG: hypothetical protein EP346_08675 [Bacteroidetes bacterium]|nr:MAG: hypothetical protein EP346_08675 [Bacteroidota bacterium]